MPAPTTNPKPSPKAPPVCKKGPKKTDGPPQLPSDRTLSALLIALLTETAIPSGVNTTLTLNPDILPDDWVGNKSISGLNIGVFLEKHEDQDLYDVDLTFDLGGAPFYDKHWSDIQPRVADPLTLPDLSYKDPSTGDNATLTIQS